METTEIGYISKTHGLKGHVILRLNEDILIDYSKVTALFLEINGSQVPYFTEECKPTNTGYIVKLENIDHVDTSKKLIGKKAFCLPQFLIENEDSLSYFVGYVVIDSTHGNIGTIVEVNDKTQNVTITIAHPSGAEIILPFNDALLNEIDDDLKTVDLNAPEGLIELYLSE